MKQKKKQTRLIDKRKAFLAAFRQTCDITAAAKQLGIDRGQHYVWMKEPAYKAAFEASIPEAAENLEHDMMHWARIGVFEPIVYKGRFQFASRKRVLCKLSDGTSAFDDELPKGAKITDRRTVTVADGELLGVYRRSERLMGALAAAWMPGKYGTSRSEHTGKDGTPLMPHEIRVSFESDESDTSHTDGEELRPLDHNPAVPPTPQVPLSEVPL